MDGGGGRVGDPEFARRVNAAAELLEDGVPVAEVARLLAERYAVSARQARRYAEQAGSSGPMAVPERSVVFTVKLPASLADRVRDQAQQSGVTISALVSRALIEFLSGGRTRKRPGR